MARAIRRRSSGVILRFGPRSRRPQSRASSRVRSRTSGRGRTGAGRTSVRWSTSTLKGSKPIACAARQGASETTSPRAVNARDRSARSHGFAANDGRARPPSGGPSPHRACRGPAARIRSADVERAKMPSSAEEPPFAPHETLGHALKRARHALRLHMEAASPDAADMPLRVAEALSWRSRADLRRADGPAEPGKDLGRACPGDGSPPDGTPGRASSLGEQAPELLLPAAREDHDAGLRVPLHP